MPPDMSFKLAGQTKILDETTGEPDHGDQPGDDLRLHGARGAVRELHPADRHHARAAAVDSLRAVHAVDDGPARSACGARSASCCCSASSRRTRFCRWTTPTCCARSGMPIREAVIEACRTRLRPILMTTSAIIAGLIPTSLGLGIGGTGRAVDRDHGHRRADALPVPDAAARAGGLREVRRARAARSPISDGSRSSDA